MLEFGQCCVATPSSHAQGLGYDADSTQNSLSAALCAGNVIWLAVDERADHLKAKSLDTRLDVEAVRLGLSCPRRAFTIRLSS